MAQLLRICHVLQLFLQRRNRCDQRLGVVAVMVVVLLCGWKLLHPSATFAADGADPDWDQAVTESHESNKPVIVIFTASWCPACQLLQSEDLSRDDVRDELDEHYVLFRVDLTRPSPAAAAHAKALGVTRSRHSSASIASAMKTIAGITCGQNRCCTGSTKGSKAVRFPVAAQCTLPKIAA